jgi:hypothetical protein
MNAESEFQLPKTKLPLEVQSSLLASPASILSYHRIAWSPSASLHKPAAKRSCSFTLVSVPPLIT